MTSFLVVALSGRDFPIAFHDLPTEMVTPIEDRNCYSFGRNGLCQFGNASMNISEYFGNDSLHEGQVGVSWGSGFLVAFIFDIILLGLGQLWLVSLQKVSPAKEKTLMQIEKSDDNVDKSGPGGAQQLFEFLDIPENECRGMLNQEGVQETLSDSNENIRGDSITCDKGIQSSFDGEDSCVQDLFDFLALDDANSGQQFCRDGHTLELCQIAGVNRCTNCKAFLFSQWGAGERGPCDSGFSCKFCSVILCSSCADHAPQHRVRHPRSSATEDIIATGDLPNNPSKTPEEAQSDEEHPADFDPLEFDRFRRARPKSETEALEMYKAHLLWRKGQGSPDNLFRGAQAIPSNYVRSYGFARDGSPMLLVQGARYDTSVNPEFYVLAVAHAIDSVLEKSSSSKLTIFIDTRPRKGWPNPFGPRLIPFFKQCASILPDNYPERVQRVIVCPLPPVFAALWRMVQKLLDPVTAEKFVVFGGSATSVPKGVSDFFDPDQLPD